MGRVVVWISETQVGLAALRQAIAEARRGGATLYAVDLTRWRPGPVGEMSLIQRHSVPADSNWHALATFNRAVNGVPTVLDVAPATVIDNLGRRSPRELVDLSMNPTVLSSGIGHKIPIRARTPSQSALKRLHRSVHSSRAFSATQPESAGGRAEPAGELVVQALLVVTDPGDVAVGT